MKRLVFVYSILILSLGVGCAVVSKGPPPSDKVAEEYVLSRKPTDYEKFAFHSVPDSYFGVSTSSHGSLLVGLLGPLGVAANVAYVKSESERQATPLASLFSADLRVALQAQSPSGLSFASPPKEGRYFALVPAATLHFRTEDEFRMYCTLNAALLDGASEIWRARYLVNVDGAYLKNFSEDVAKAKSALGPCLAKAHSLFRQHKAHKLGTLKEYVVNTDMELVAPLLESALPDRIIFNDDLGIYEFRKSDVRKYAPR